MTSQTPSQVRFPCDSHPNRPSRPVPSRPFCRYRSLASHRYLAPAPRSPRRPAVPDAACNAFGEIDGGVR